MSSDSDDEYPPFPKFTGPASGREWCAFEWDMWRKHFEIVVGLRKLNDGDAKCHARLSMTGVAASITMHIKRGPDEGPDMVRIGMYLDRLEALFSPPPGSVKAQYEFEEYVRQGQQGDMQGHYYQLKFLWQRAYPQKAQNFEDEPELRRKFIMGIPDTTVRKKLQEKNPRTYSETLALAWHIEANIAFLKNHGQ